MLPGVGDPFDALKAGTDVEPLRDRERRAPSVAVVEHAAKGLGEFGGDMNVESLVDHQAVRLEKSMLRGRS